MRPRRTLALLLAAALACSASDNPEGPPLSPETPTRTFRMGFSAFPAKPDEQALLDALAMWTQRADAAIMHISVPYKALLTGTSATDYVTANDLPVAQYFRAKNLQLWVTLDVTNGLDRSAEAPDLVELGRSIQEPAVQQAYRDYVLAISALVHPEYLGLAAETNLIRRVAPAALYDAMEQMTNAAATDLQAAGSTSARYVSVQVDQAWGRLLDGNVYQGIATDFADFPFVQALGLSSYPYFVFQDPDEVPLDYYSRLTIGHPIPVGVVEGGWTSGDAVFVQSTPEAQARYIRRQAAILDSAGAKAVFQLNFTDIDVPSLNLPPGTNITPFAQLGLVDTELNPKPALAVWDSVFAVKRAP